MKIKIIILKKYLPIPSKDSLKTLHKTIKKVEEEQIVEIFGMGTCQAVDMSGQ